VKVCHGSLRSFLLTGIVMEVITVECGATRRFAVKLMYADYVSLIEEWRVCTGKLCGRPEKSEQ